MEVDVEGVDLRGAAVRQSYELGAAVDGDMDRHLEVVLLLADERVVLRREVEALVRVHTVSDQRTAQTPPVVEVRGARGAGGSASPAVDLAPPC